MKTVQRLRRFVLAAAAILAGILGIVGAAAQTAGTGADGRVVLLAAIEGPIGPATVRQIEKLVERAAAPGVEAIVLRLDTPGGLAESMREIIASILAAPVPVIGWVAPPGAHAASAGTYILYATHLAAMAPGTNLGAATPVMIGGMPGLPGPGEGEGGHKKGEGEKAKGGKGEETRPPLSGSAAMTAKVTNDAVAFIRSLAELHGRNAEWAEKAVREAASLSAREALRLHVIDLMAETVDELLAAADGRKVKFRGGERVLHTAGVKVVEVEPDAITRLLAVLSNPNVAFILMLMGIYGIIFEFLHPGTVLPGVVGAIALTLALFALNQLPLDYAGLALVFLGIAFMVAEALSPSFGVLGLGGLVAFVLGALMLFNTEAPQYRLSPWLIGTMAALSAAFLILLLGYTWRSYRRAPVSGTARLIGARAEVLEWSGESGFVWVEGERWAARGPAGLAPGDSVEVRAIDGLTLSVARPAAAPTDMPSPRAAE